MEFLTYRASAHFLGDATGPCRSRNSWKRRKKKALSCSPTREAAFEAFLIAQHEGRFGSISRPQSCWASSGFRPEAPAHSVRAFIDAFTAVAPSPGKIGVLLLPHVDTESMNVFFARDQLHIHTLFLRCRSMGPDGLPPKIV
jgi:hypothetical protein